MVYCVMANAILFAFQALQKLNVMDETSNCVAWFWQIYGETIDVAQHPKGMGSWVTPRFQNPWMFESPL